MIVGRDARNLRGADVLCWLGVWVLRTHTPGRAGHRVGRCLIPGPLLVSWKGLPILPTLLLRWWCDDCE